MVEIAIDEHIFGEVQRRAHSVARVSCDGHALIGAWRLALDERMVHAKPGGAGSVEEAPCRKPIFDQIAVTESLSPPRDLDDRALVGRLRSVRRRMARRSCRNGRVLLALHERGETRDVLVLGASSDPKSGPALRPT